jgi:geranylgeranyl pyrophosphate synthase
VNTVNFFGPIQDGLKEVERLLHCQAEDAHPELCAVLDHLLASGGKRIRPSLGLLTGQMLGAPPSRLITLCAAVELLHTATLVHDDLIDGSLLRRGNPTLNSQWSPSATVLTGDFIFARAAHLAAETDNLQIMKSFAQTLAVIVNGELTQLFTARNLASREIYYRRIYAKTASLIEMATCSAAMISPVSEATIAAMKQFGYHLGMAFQIVDDVLDFTAEVAEIGKPVGNDLLQGLITLPALYYIESRPEDAAVQALLSPTASLERPQIEELVQAIRDSDAIRCSLDEADTLAGKALEILKQIPDGPERQGLVELTNYIVKRRS